MQILIKSLLSLAVILAVTAIGRKAPSAAGLVSVMPTIGALALVWTCLDSKGDPITMQKYAKGALLGLLPTALFFFAAFVCFKKQCSLPIVLAVSSGAWALAAAIHQWIVR